VTAPHRPVSLGPIGGGEGPAPLTTRSSPQRFAVSSRGATFGHRLRKPDIGVGPRPPISDEDAPRPASFRFVEAANFQAVTWTFLYLENRSSYPNSSPSTLRARPPVRVPSQSQVEAAVRGGRGQDDLRAQLACPLQSRLDVSVARRTDAAGTAALSGIRDVEVLARSDGTHLALSSTSGGPRPPPARTPTSCSSLCRPAGADREHAPNRQCGDMSEPDATLLPWWTNQTCPPSP
jgi:hypothetical protein